MARIFIAVMIALSASLAVAKNDVVVRPNVTSNDLKAMTFEQLKNAFVELQGSWEKISELVRRKDDSDMSAVKSINDIAAYRGIEENVVSLLSVIRTEAQRYAMDENARKLVLPAENKLETMPVIAAAIDSLKKVGTPEPQSLMDELDALIKEVDGHLGNLYGVQAALKQARTQIKSRSGETSVSLVSIIAELKEKQSTPESRLKTFKKILGQRVIGQPEVIELLEYMELRTQLYGETRTQPEAIYLMGLPGTGKDTIAEAWTDALNGYKGAHREHMFRLPVMRQKEDLWKVLGSSTGYIGSESIPPFLKFLIEHSGGHYIFKQNVKGKTELIENPDWKGKNLDGFATPDQAVVFANEFHNWSRDLKDTLLKQALEKGYISINNPNGGPAEIYVPVRFLIASNEGIPLLTAREANGQRVGKPLTYEQMLTKWDRVHDDKNTLIHEILSTAGAANDAIRQDSLGTSEELLNRIPKRNVLMLRPLSPADLKEIADLALKNLAEKLQVPSVLFAGIDLKWSDNLVKYIQEYKYVPEENARPILARVMSTVEEPLLNAIRNGQLKGQGQKVTFSLDVAENPDNTRSLVIKTDSGEIKEVIPETLGDKPKPAITDARIDELSQFAKLTNDEVFGVDTIVQRLGDRVLSIANELSAGDAARPANVMGVFGLTSTGKTELAKKTAKRLMGSEDDLVVLDFSQIQTLHDFKTRILGLKDGLGNPISSDFMKAYDRSNGVMVVAFDEMANVKDPDLLTALYDFFREPEVATFSDGKPRKMGGVFVIVTGNAGQNIFKAVPRDIPPEVQMTAWKEIADKLARDVNLQLQVLEQYLPWPLITRIGKNNLFFVPPHTYRSLRQLAQLKLTLALKRIGNTDGRRGWKVLFANTTEYRKFIDTIIEEGFSLRYQGASIDSYIRDDFEENLKSILLKNKVASGSTVVLKFRDKTANNKEETPGFVTYDVSVDNATPLDLKLRRPFVEKRMQKLESIQMLTAYHEAGHSLVREVLFPGVYTPERISIIPGVAMIENKWIYYAGIASNNKTTEVNYTRDAIIRELAVLTAGETSERMVSNGEQHSAGKSNDIERASRIARDAILRYGLSEKWGVTAVPSNTDVNVYIQGLSNERKQLLESEVQAMVNEGRSLAEAVIALNYNDSFLPLGAQLGAQGDMLSEDLAKFYQSHTLKSPDTTSTLSRWSAQAASKWRALIHQPAPGFGTQIANGVPMPKTMANIEAIALKQQQDMYASVPLPDDLPVVSREEAAKPIDCADILK